jgi:TRAP-type C4-dicarboxylate transport system permease small subunit
MTTAESNAYPESSQATTALVLGILGLICCQPLGIIAWVLANKELEGIRSGLRNPDNQGMATAARVLGIIGAVFLALGILFGLAFFLGLIATNRSVLP